MCIDIENMLSILVISRVRSYYRINHVRVNIAISTMTHEQYIAGARVRFESQNIYEIGGAFWKTWGQDCATLKKLMYPYYSSRTSWIFILILLLRTWQNRDLVSSYAYFPFFLRFSFLKKSTSPILWWYHRRATHVAHCGQVWHDVAIFVDFPCFLFSPLPFFSSAPNYVQLW